MRLPALIRGRALTRAAAVPLAALLCGIAAAPAWAAEGSIDYVEPGSDSFQVLFSLPGGGGTPDLDTVQVTLDDQVLPATGELATDAATSVRRTAVLAMDVSLSMRQDGRFTEAKQAAQVFLDNAPDDLYVGIVTFASEVSVAQPPSLDRAASAQVLDDLTLTRDTRLYDGVLEAVDTAGEEGARNVLVLSDGRDTSGTELDRVTAAIERAETQVDVVALAQTADDTALLQRLSDAGDGSIIPADDPEALSQVFAAQAATLASQILLTVEAPADGAREGTLGVSLQTDTDSYTDTAFVTVATAAEPESEPAVAPEATTLVPVEASGPVITREMMLGGVAALGLGVLLLLLGAMGVLGGSKKETVEDRVSVYTQKGARALGKKQQAQAQATGGMTAQAVGVAQKALESNSGLATKLGQKLDAAGMNMNAAEWLLTHIAVAFLGGLVALLLGSGNILFALVGLVLGAIGPWLYLSLKRSRRTKRFKAQLADTLQLMSGALSAGLSLAQAVDTVVREGSDPIAGEFRRALMEARLGVEIETALEGIAERMESKDFEWVVMAIRIQREVGGNLSELLTTVAATIREREYLERQVLALSAEGRLSVWILGGLPPAFLVYLMLTNPTYLEPLVSTPLGWIMLGGMVVMLVVGIVWMKKLVKVEV